MVVTALPDLAGAINARLRTSSTIAALAGTKISTSRQAAWGLPAYAVLIETGKGGGEDTPGLLWERVDVRCYGAGDALGTQVRNAHTLWRTLHYFFCPPVGSGRASGFVAASTSVLKVAHEGGPLRLIEPDEAWPYTLASYRVTYAEQPVS
jgi:hypothetical protein